MRGMIRVTTTSTPCRGIFFACGGGGGGRRASAFLVVKRRRDGFKGLHSSAGLSDRFDTNIVRSKFPDIPLSTQNYFDFLWSNRSKHASRLALVDAVTDRSLTYSDAHRQAKNFGLALQKLGAVKGDVLALLLPNCLEYPLLFSGAPSAGVTLTTLNPIYTAAEIAKQLKMSKAGWAVTNKELLPTMLEAVKALGDDAVDKLEDRILVLGDPHSSHQSADDLLLTDLPGETSVTIDVHNDICVLPFSSGTTGVPKGVMLTHFNLVANACQVTPEMPEMSLVPEATDACQPVTICILPLFHAFAMNVTMTPALYRGAKLVIVPKFDPRTLPKTIAKYKPTFLHLPPPLVSFLASCDDITAEHLAHMDHIVVAAAPSGPALIKKFKAKAPHCVYREGWGMTETSPIVHMTPLDDEHNGSCGVLVPNTEAKILDLATGETLGPGERGELCVRGPMVMKGYLDNPTATTTTIVDGWLHSGDIAIYDEQGHFFIVDRLKELIKVKGFQVPPAELEDLLRSHEGVQDVAVIGVEHEKFGEAPRAYIVPKTAGLTEADINGFMARNAAAYKQLAGGIEFLPAIPKTSAGKILRKELLKKYLDEKS